MSIPVPDTSHSPSLHELIDALGDARSPLYPQAATTLLQLGDVAEPALVAALHHPNQHVRLIVIQILSKHPSRQIQDALVGVITHDDAQTRHMAAAALKWIGTPEPVSALLAIGQQLSYAERRDMAVCALGWLGDPQAVVVLIDLVQHDPYPLIRQHAASALGEIGDQRAVSVLLTALATADEHLTNCILCALGRLRDPQVFDILLSALQSDNEIFQNTAALALGDLGDLRAVDPLINVLTYHHTALTCNAMSALARLGSPRAKAAILDVRDHGDELLRAQISFILGM